ncbi:MAG: hypothetical protein U5J63_03265 [Fodinibius sp.]|nr:hypothetical protein [Fodinibius sp.]
MVVSQNRLSGNMIFLDRTQSWIFQEQLSMITETAKKTIKNQGKIPGGGRMYSFTDEAQFAWNITVDDNYLYSVRHHNNKEGYKYLDIYAVEDGNLGSFTLSYYPKEIAVDNNYIYTIEVSAQKSLPILFDEICKT